MRTNQKEQEEPIRNTRNTQGAGNGHGSTGTKPDEPTKR